MASALSDTVVCQVCGQEKPRDELVAGSAIRECIANEIRKELPDWSPKGFICRADLDRFKAQYVMESLEADRGELSEIEKEVVNSLVEAQTLSKNTNDEFDSKLTFGQRVADKVAEFGGSWRFIIGFMGLLAVWVIINSVALLRKPFDPFPFILLNLFLSGLAGLQAPIIMMSQNRQEAKDRMRAENDYQVNLKAEIEIRNLHQKIDHLLNRQWQRLMEIQQIQTDLMEELAAGNSPPR